LHLLEAVEYAYLPLPSLVVQHHLLLHQEVEEEEQHHHLHREVEEELQPRLLHQVEVVRHHHLHQEAEEVETHFSDRLLWDLEHHRRFGQRAPAPLRHSALLEQSFDNSY
jgi:hypothetical protein